VADDDNDLIDTPAPTVIRCEIDVDDRVIFTFEAVEDGQVYSAQLPHKAVRAGEAAVRRLFAQQAQALRDDAARTLRTAAAYDQLAARPVILPDMLGGEGWPL
jgi:hypothetical protein